MEIKAKLSPNITILSKFSTVLILFFNFLVILCAEWDLLSFSVLFFLLSATYSIRLWFTYGRIFVFDKSGCTVTFKGIYKKHYTWDDLTPIYYKNQKAICKHKAIYNKKTTYSSTDFRPRNTIVFFLKNNPLKKWGWIGSYDTLFNPFSIFVCFSDFDHDREATKIYIAPHDEFLEKLNTWGVDIQYLFK